MPVSNAGTATADVGQTDVNNPQPSSETAHEGKSDALEDMRRVEKEHYGFWNIPNEWVIFLDVDAAEDDDMIQYSDKLGKNIITARYFDDLKLTPEELLNRQAVYMQEIGGENITGATVKLNGIDALQIYC